MSNLIGTAPDQVPVNGMLGIAAFLDSDVPFSGALTATKAAPTIASAATIAPTSFITLISSVEVSVVTITPPANLLATGGQITLIPLGVFSTTTAGNIALATTTVIGKALIMTYDAVTLKWYPSY